jgi:recombination protein RecA
MANALLDRLPTEFIRRVRNAGVALGAEAPSVGSLSFGWSLEQGWLRGQVTELCVAPSGGLGTRLALGACAQAQQLKNGFSDEANWCAFVDPSGSLYAPGVAAQGVRLDRLLVVRPPIEALGRVALRLARSKVFVLLVVDTSAILGQSRGMDWGGWARIVRQMSLALEGSDASVLLLTKEGDPRPVALPVARRIEARRIKPDVLRLRTARDRFQQAEPWRNVVHPVTRFDEPIRHAG